MRQLVLPVAASLLLGKSPLIAQNAECSSLTTSR